MAAQQGVIGQRAMIGHMTVVRDVRAGHEVVAVADDGSSRFGRSAMDRDVLAEDVAVADFDAGRFIAVLQVLRLLADDGVAVNLVVLAHRERPDQVRPRADREAGPESDLTLQNGKSPDGDIRGQFHLGGE